MIVHAKVFETKYRTLMAEHTLQYQSNYNLDYEFIAEKCTKVIKEMEEFDGKMHQMDSRETKGLYYFFQYVKKNLIVIAAIDHAIQPGIFESQCRERFVKFHSEVEKTARKNFRNRYNLQMRLTQTMQR